MKNALLNNWNFRRVFRLGIGLAILVQAVVARDAGIIVLGLAFTAMPLFNVGCCAGTACSAAPPRNAKSPADEITYEEVG